MKKTIIFLTISFVVCVSKLMAQSGDQVRILLDTTERLSVACTGLFQLEDLSGRMPAQYSYFLPETEIALKQDQVLWNSGPVSFPKGFRMVVQEDAALVVNHKRYRGNLEIQIDPETHKLFVINILSMEKYLLGVVSREVSYDWPSDVLKAQAIVARTYTYERMRLKKYPLFDVHSGVGSQVYGGVYAETTETDNAVRNTKDQVLMVNGDIFPAFYHAACGGKTEDAHDIWDMQSPALVSHACPHCSDSPYQDWESTYSAKDLSEALKDFSGAQKEPVQALKIVTRSASGRVKWMEINYTNGKSIKMSGNTFRIKCGADRFKSAAFEVKQKGSSFVFYGHGWGHGVGLCQWGAKGMAERAQANTAEILSFYYPQATLQDLHGHRALVSKPELSV